MLMRQTTDPLLQYRFRPSAKNTRLQGPPCAQVNQFTYKKGQEIYGECERAEYIYQVVEGAVRGYKLLPDGRRQIGAFHFKGDVFGLENDACHRFTTEALVKTTVKLTRRSSLEKIAGMDAELALDLLSLTTESLCRAENHMLLLGRKTATERVAAFLLEMDGRLKASGIIMLPMTRRDIADYLGITLETVSRTLSRFEDRGIIAFSDTTQRLIILRNREKLSRLETIN